MTTAKLHRTFGQKTVPHTIIIARGDNVRHVTIRPRTVAMLGTLVGAIVLGPIAAAGAFFILHAQPSEFARGADDELLQHAYETRIAALRNQLDRAVSRQMLDKQSVETKVGVLLDQQMELSARYDKLMPLIERARDNGLLAPDAASPGPVPAKVPIPQPNPIAADPAAPEPVAPVPGALAFAPSDTSSRDPAELLQRFRLIDGSKAQNDGEPTFPGSAALPKPSAAISNALIRQIGDAIETVEGGQIEGIDALSESARNKAAGIASALRVEGIGLPLPLPAVVGAEGGPFEPVPPGLAFDALCDRLDSALDHLQAVRRSASRLPLGTPVDAIGVSSTFGVRPDPFLGRSAMHTGIDLVAEAGKTVTASAPGKVVEAGVNGGYGLMVEVDHGGGIVTRYAHLSAILVSVGASVVPGDAIGLVGSTGRSTGPHLHYEVRVDGEAVDPSRYLRAGRRIRALI